MGNVAGTEARLDRRELTATACGRVDAVLAAAFPDLSRSRLQRLIADGRATVNGAIVRKSADVALGDVVAVEIPPVDHPVPAITLVLPVLYEDSALLAVDKPAGIAVHGAPGDTAPCVATWFLASYPDLAPAFDAERPGVVHRLDKNTSGVLLLAKTPRAQAALSAAFESRAVEKTYLAICRGVPRQPRAVVDGAIARHPDDRTRMAIVKRGGRDARTEYEVLGSDHGNAFLLVHPSTGRTHQIRVHLAAIGAAVMGDHTYGRQSGDAPVTHHSSLVTPARHLLHAWRITIPHPDGGMITVTAPLAADMRAAARSLGFEGLALPYTEPVPPERTQESPSP
jgi:23S rRNA pseudouridine1911/1915/1917 synthase